MEKNIGILVGSLRAASFNRKVAKQLVKFAPEDLKFQFIEIGDLPLYNQDLDEEETPPESYTRFRNEMREIDAFLFVTPEYNRSVSAVLKNALDVGSRPYGKSIWGGKPAGIVSVSIGSLGGFGANHHLRQSLTFLDVPAMQQPEAYIGQIQDSLDEDGNCNNPQIEDMLRKYIQAYRDWVFNF